MVKSGVAHHIEMNACPTDVSSPEPHIYTQDIFGSRRNRATKSGVAHHCQKMNTCPTDVMMDSIMYSGYTRRLLHSGYTWQEVIDLIKLILSPS
jgi:hypothetical protein